MALAPDSVRITGDFRCRDWQARVGGEEERACPWVGAFKEKDEITGA